MLGSIPHQKFCFYHLPTWGRAGIKLGDAWYVSNVSIIFDCSMLYYLLFWTLLGFIVDVYIIFGTNLLIGGPAQNCFFACFRVSKTSNIKQSPNATKLHDDFLWARRKEMGPGCTWGVHRGGHNPPGRGRRPRRALVCCAHLGCPPDRLFAL